MTTTIEETGSSGSSRLHLENEAEPNAGPNVKFSVKKVIEKLRVVLGTVDRGIREVTTSA
jgi:hypothetical protein